jgi:RNA 2',3'-cyclic 3'-phosphodiesterase
MPRLFTGLEIPPEIATELAMLRGGVAGARWVEPENYHITLRFMGDIDYGAARDIASLLDQISRPQLTLTLAGLDTFGGDKPRAIVIRIAPCQALIELQAEQERLVRRVGLAPETRKFSPHVTLARLRNASARQVAGFLASRGRIPALRFSAQRFVLYSSRASTGGGPYVVEADYPLTPEGAGVRFSGAPSA